MRCATYVVANVLEREVRVQQALYAAVSQDMRTRARYADTGLADEVRSTATHRR